VFGNVTQPLKWFDFDSLVVALMRLRRAAVLAGIVPEITDPVTTALGEFDSALPNLNGGRLPTVQRQDLEVSSAS
jgi:hypothetical protein